jgi:hypothetical protein
MQNSLQLKILQDGGAVGDRQLEWLSRPVFVAMFADFEHRRTGADLFCPAQVAQYALTGDRGSSWQKA